MRFLGIIVGFLIASSAASWAQENAEDRLSEVIELAGQAKKVKILQQAWNLYKSGDYGDALSIWMPLAEMGNPSAQVFIGLMYNKGLAVKQNTIEAEKWYTLASNQGHVPAIWRLAMLYYHGSGLTQDYKKAADLYLLAAKQGDVYSQKAIGVMYSKGFGVPKDNILAYSWVYIAHANGFDLAKNNQINISEKMIPQEITMAEAIAKACMKSGYEKCGWIPSAEDDLVKDDT